MPTVNNTLSKLKQAAQAVAPLVREASTQAPAAIRVETATQKAGDTFHKWLPAAKQMMASAGQSYGGNMANVAREPTLTPQQRAEAFRARNQGNLAGRTGLVTGAAGNIGSETAFMMASHGMNVMLTDIPRANLDNVAETCKLLGAPKVAISKHDLTAEEGRANLISDTLAAVGSPYATAMCAGIYVDGGLWKNDAASRAKQLEHFERAMKINVTSPTALAEAFVPHLEAGAHMLVVNSLAGETPVKGEPLYCGTKYALDGIWSTLAKDYSDLGIKFEQVFPSALLGPMAAGRPGLHPELLHYAIAVVRGIESAFLTQGNSYLPRIRVSGTISPYNADHN